MPKIFKCYFGCVVVGPLHRYPKWVYPCEERFNSWKAVLDFLTQERGNEYIYNNIRLCNRHFEDCHQLPSRRLTKCAIPTLNLSPFLQHKTEVEVVSVELPSPSLETTLSSQLAIGSSAHERLTTHCDYATTDVVKSNVSKRIVWMDLEMTGLDIEKDHILEIACLVTNADLDVIATGPNIVIHQPDDILNSMGEWCTTQHGETGLTEASRKSSISVKEAERQILEFVSCYVPKSTSPLAGNSVYMDRLFIRKYMSNLDSYLHYRIIDVSTIKELGKRWYPKEYSKIPHKECKHRCISDILESIQELKYYKENLFK